MDTKQSQTLTLSMNGSLVSKRQFYERKNKFTLETLYNNDWIIRRLDLPQSHKHTNRCDFTDDLYLMYIYELFEGETRSHEWLNLFRDCHNYRNI